MNNREKAVDIFLKNPDLTQKKIAGIVGVSLATVRIAIRNYRLNIPLIKKRNSGRKKGTADKQLEKKALNLFERYRNISSRDMARKLGTSQTMVQLIKKRNGYQSLIKQNVAKKTLKHFNKGIDDEKYAKLDLAPGQCQVGNIIRRIF